MKLTKISVQNYKALKDTETELSRFSCVVGENNAGKSSLMQAILRLLAGRAIDKHEYHNPSAEILITGIFTEVTEVDINKVHESHRETVRAYIKEGRLGLARRYAVDGTSKLRVLMSVPREERFRTDTIEEHFKGLKGGALLQRIKDIYPEIVTTETPKSKAAAVALVETYVATLGPDKRVEEDVPLGTGIDNSIKPMLPEPIYIPAVKDFADDLKTKDSASFGKLLSILLTVIQSDLADADRIFKELQTRLSRVLEADGTISDNRLERVKAIERTIQKNLQESFSSVGIELEIPPPKIDSLLSNASIIANDGVRGPIEQKGDGFKRAITFSILRAFVQLSQDPDWRAPDDTTACRNNFIFLFEEPELYLHPKAQHILFEALALISSTYPVIVTTHSPLFLTWENTGTFIKMTKDEGDSGTKPSSACKSVSLSDIPTKDAFQIVSFETSNHAFFARRIILVEGDSDMIAYPHITRVANPAWVLKASNICLVQTRGKGNFQKYVSFFSRFGVPIVLIADLDIIVEGFDKIEPSADAIRLRSDLLAAVDAVIDAENLLTIPTRALLKEELQKERITRLYDTLIEARVAKDVAKQGAILAEIMIFERTRPRLVVLKDHSRQAIVELKRRLLAQLRTENVVILEKGAIEAYYPRSIAGNSDKVKRAQEFCATITTRAELDSLSEDISPGAENRRELTVISEVIMGLTR